MPVAILHGLDGSGPGHWQTWLAGRLSENGHDVRYPALPDAGRPLLEPWLSALASTLSGLPAGGFDVVCHSLAVPLWLYHTGLGTGPWPARVLLVAPPAPTLSLPALAPFLPPPLDGAAVRAAATAGTVVVCSDDDPFCPQGAEAAYGAPLGLPTVVVPSGGHLNTDAGYGPWPAMEAWCASAELAFVR